MTPTTSLAPNHSSSAPLLSQLQGRATRALAGETTSTFISPANCCSENMTPLNFSPVSRRCRVPSRSAVACSVASATPRRSRTARVAETMRVSERLAAQSSVCARKATLSSDPR